MLSNHDNDFVIYAMEVMNFHNQYEPSPDQSILIYKLKKAKKIECNFLQAAKKLKKRQFNFLQAQKSSKNMNSIFATLKKLEKHENFLQT